MKTNFRELSKTCLNHKIKKVKGTKKLMKGHLFLFKGLIIIHFNTE
jgi:hypothetical protein